MNCRKRGAPKLGDVQVNKDPSRDGGDKKSYSDKHGMERHGGTHLEPEKSGEVVEHPR
jgi:hypothetical protein